MDDLGRILVHTLRVLSKESMIYDNVPRVIIILITIHSSCKHAIQLNLNIYLDKEYILRCLENCPGYIRRINLILRINPDPRSPPPRYIFVDLQLLKN